MIIEIVYLNSDIVINTDDWNIPFEISMNGETVAYGNGFDGVTWHELGITNPVWIYQIVCILVDVTHRQHDEQAVIDTLLDFTSSNFKNGFLKK